MVKTTVYIDEITHRRLKQLARRQGRSQAEVMREALAAYVAQASLPRPKGIGAYRSRRSHVAEKAEELLRRSARRGP